MKEYFYTKDYNAYIIDDKEGLLVRANKDNIKETLVTQNNIEQIENELNDVNEKRLERKTFLDMIVKRGIILTSLLSIIMIFILGVSSTFLTLSQMSPMILLSLFSVGIFGIQAFNKNDIKKEIKACEVYINELEKELEKEKDKLKQLELVANNKTIDYTCIKKIPKTEILANLTRKKEIIIDYMLTKKKYNTLYQNGTLDSFLQSKNYSESDIEFVKTVMQEETKQEETNKKSKQKIK